MQTFCKQLKGGDKDIYCADFDKEWLCIVGGHNLASGKEFGLKKIKLWLRREMRRRKSKEQKSCNLNVIRL